MGYSNFGKVKTIVFPIELPNAEDVEIIITRNQYLEKYGIDIASIVEDPGDGVLTKDHFKNTLVLLSFNSNSGKLKNQYSDAECTVLWPTIFKLSDDALSLTNETLTIEDPASGNKYDLTVILNHSSVNISLQVIE